MIVSLIYYGLIGVIVFASMLFEPKVVPAVSFDSYYLGRHHTNVIKGIAILCVIASHIGNANGVRLTAPAGGIGVALFLICSGYGLTESSKKYFSYKSFVKKRIVSVLMPYALTRILMVILTRQKVSILDFMLDVLCVSPQYIFGWYLQYLMICYIVFCAFWHFNKKHGKIAFWGLLVISVFSFFISPTELQAEQCLSFVTGVMLSEYKERIEHILKAPQKSLICTFLSIGMLAFLAKQFFGVQIEHCIYGLQLIYKYCWALMLILISTILVQKYRMNTIALIGEYSYEIYLTHGYFFELMKGIFQIPVFLGIEVLLSILLKKIFNLGKRFIFR